MLTALLVVVWGLWLLALLVLGARVWAVRGARVLVWGRGASLYGGKPLGWGVS